jgi:hypothetical protein
VNVVALRILIIVWILFTWLAPPMLAQLAPSTATKRCLALCALALSVVGLYSRRRERRARPDRGCHCWCRTGVRVCGSYVQKQPV